jgi:hypothetical protein
LELARAGQQRPDPEDPDAAGGRSGPLGSHQPADPPAGKPAVDRLTAQHGRVVALQGEQRYSAAVPVRRSFPDFRPELESYPLLAVRCAYFGEPLGVFTTAEAALTTGEAEEIAGQISSAAPHRVRSSVAGS